MEVEGATNHKGKVFLYELFGTAFLAYAVLTSAGNSVAVAFSVFVIIVILGPITGAHMNPAVTIGVFTTRAIGGQGKDIGFFLLILLAEFIGAFVGMLWAIGSLYTSGNNIPLQYIPLLCPATTDFTKFETDPCAEDRHF